MVYFGSAIFKIVRLLLIAMFSVHFFACAFFRVKQGSATPDDIATFFAAKGVQEDVSLCMRRELICLLFSARFGFFWD